MAYYHVISGGAGSATGADWTNAWGWAELNTNVANLSGGGDTVFIRGNISATATTAFYSNDGTASSPVNFIGVKSGTTNTGASITTSDWAVDLADMPVITCGSYYIFSGDYYYF